MNDNRYLMHHGVRGMKWGVRKESNRNLRAAAASQRDANSLRKAGYLKEAAAVQKVANKQKAIGEKKLARKNARIERKRAKAMDRATSARYTYKQRKHLSDDELRARINRLNMEKQLKDLSKGRSSGPELIMLDNGQRAARQALGKYGAKVALNAVGLGGAADFIRPKK